MTDDKKKIGRLGEEAACEYLAGLGYEILERNYETYSGEIDIVALDTGEDGDAGRKSGTMVFVEVKSRKDKRYGRAAHAVNREKLLHIVNSSAIYVKRHPWLKELHQRIDVIEVYSDGTLEHIKNVNLEGVVNA